ncbi:MAG: hypothetical protein UMR38_01490 [Candidatus Izemoplasma sp.]|nr:hypothetical protein [Candidatus Izemoplasma sp.]
MLPYIMIGSLVLVYILSYALNKKVPVPQASLDKIDEATCKSCHNFSCSHRGDA